MEDLLEGTLFEKDDGFTEGWIELSACCYNCGRIVSAKADIDRLDKFVAMCDTHRHPDNLDYWGGPMFAAIDTWTESPHWYRELMIAAVGSINALSYPDLYEWSEEDYYCDKCFNDNYPEGIDDSDFFKTYYRTKLFMESMEAEKPGSAKWHWLDMDEATRKWRKELWDKAGDQVYGRR